MGVLRKKTGSIKLRGEDITRLDSHQIARKGIAYVPEERAIFATLTVKENLELPPVWNPKGWSSQKCTEAFPALSARGEHSGAKLSGGEQQMLAIARVLRAGPTLLLLDEPSEGLAPVVVQQIQKILRGLKAEGMAMLLVEQNLHFALSLADRHTLLVDGEVTVIAVDHQNKADIASNKASEMYDRLDVDAIFDTVNSACALATSAIAAQKKKVFIDTGAGTSELTNEKCNKFTFHYAYDNYMLANGTGTTTTKQGGKSWYMIYPNYAFGQNLERQFRAAVEKNGGKVVAPSEATPFPNTDFSNYLLTAQSLKPQVFGTMQAGPDLVNVVKL